MANSLMIALLVGWGCLGLVTSIIGLGILNALQIQAIHRWGDRFVVSAWLGILVLAWLLFSLSLAMPLSPMVGLIVVLVLMGLALAQHRCRQEIQQRWQQVMQLNLRFKLLILGLGLAIAAFATQPIIWPDTGLYHYPATQWFAQYGTVPGLALVHHRFGTNSAWFALTAPLEFGIFAERSNTFLGGFIFGLGAIQLAYTIRRLLNGEKTWLNWFVCLALFLLMPTMFWGYLPFSNSPDQPVLFISFLIAWLILLTASQPTQRHNQEALIPLMIGALAAPIKLSALPMLVLVFGFYACHPIQSISVRRIGIGMGISSLTILPLLSFNFITSGCFLYPSALSCTNVPWSVGRAVAEREYQAIQQWNQWWGSRPPDAGPGDWIGPWLGLEGQLAFLIVCSLIAFGVICYRYRDFKMPGQFYVLSLASLGTLYVFKAAPSWRFGLGYACLLPAWLLADYCARSSRLRAVSILVVAGAANLWLALPSLSFLIVLVVAIAAAIYAYLWHRRLTTTTFLLLLTLVSTVILIRHYPTTYQSLGLQHRLQLWLPPKLSTVFNNDKVQSRTINGVQYFFPKQNSELCWAAPLPCTPILTHEDLELRDPAVGFAAGFQRSIE
ncbi:MAG: hypothetical protein F6J87_14640 [Spirulina sp. SIO3F2]|nr:hypothetical protein [Spirulina sp. SIO3F2]